MNYLAEDYAAMRGWCNYTHPAAEIAPLANISPAVAAAAAAFTWGGTRGEPARKVRLAFFFTLYDDASFVRRLLARLYSRGHLYLLHVDPAGAAPEFLEDMRAMAQEYNAEFNGTGVVMMMGCCS